MSRPGPIVESGMSFHTLGTPLADETFTRGERGGGVEEGLLGTLVSVIFVRLVKVVQHRVCHIAGRLEGDMTKGEEKGRVGVLTGRKQPQDSITPWSSETRRPK